MSAMVFPRQAYYERIGAAKALLPLLAPQGQTVPPTGSPTVNIWFLKQLMLAHISSIPFENIDVLLGRRVSIAPKDIYDKLIHARRGGYCFEQNTLMYEALRDAGFRDIRRVAARVIWADENSPSGRTHMLNIVTLPAKDSAEPQQWMVDVGFGAGGVPGAPLLLSTTEPQTTINGLLRVRTRDPCPELTGGWSEYVVDLQVGSGWRSMYHFDLQPQWMRDFYMMNYLINNESLFKGTLQASRAEGTWVQSTATDKDDTTYAVVAATGYTYVPRGVYTVASFDTPCTTNVKPPFCVPEASAALLAEVGGVLPGSQSQPSTAGELYDWLRDEVQIDFAQTRLPQHGVSRAEFVKAVQERLVAFGGCGFTVPHNL